MPGKIFKVDAFASSPFTGNPAAVCLPGKEVSELWMSQIAREMNVSETAFLVPRLQPEGGQRAEDFDLRWFTPTVEVDLCGHATLASAHILWEKGIIRPEAQARFHTRSGLLTASKPEEWIELDFPVKTEESLGAVPDFEAILGSRPLNVARNKFDYLVELDSAATVRNLSPDIPALAKLPVRGVIVTSAAGAGPYDFISRFFAPAAGVDEDPVTGSAHCFLAPYWSARLGGKLDLHAFQASSRGGELRLTLRGDRVIIRGQAVTVMQGTLAV